MYIVSFSSSSLYNECILSSKAALFIASSSAWAKNSYEIDHSDLKRLRLTQSHCGGQEAQRIRNLTAVTVVVTIFVEDQLDSQVLECELNVQTNEHLRCLVVSTLLLASVDVRSICTIFANSST